VEDMVDKYIRALSYKIDNNPKFTLFRSNDPDFNKDIVLKEARMVAIQNMKETGKPNIQPHQMLTILKNIKKSNEICKLLEANHAYITHIKEDGTLQYVFSNFGYRRLKALGLV
jgi:hypothetical protein